MGRERPLLKDGVSPSPNPTYSPRTSPTSPPLTWQKYDLLLQVAGMWGKFFCGLVGWDLFESAGRSVVLNFMKTRSPSVAAGDSSLPEGAFS